MENFQNFRDTSGLFLKKKKMFRTAYSIRDLIVKMFRVIMKREAV